MKGLFIKDMLSFRKINKITGSIGTVALLVFLLLMKSDIGFYIANFIILPLNAATQASLLSYHDEQWKWKHYMIAAPTTAKDIVASRMLASYLIFAIKSISVELFNVAFLLTHRDFSRELFMFIVISAIILTAISVSIFIIGDFVNNNNRKLASLLQILLILLGAVLIYAISKAPASILEAMLTVSKPMILFVIGVVFIVITIFTYLVSISMVRKR